MGIAANRYKQSFFDSRKRRSPSSSRRSNQWVNYSGLTGAISVLLLLGWAAPGVAQEDSSVQTTPTPEISEPASSEPALPGTDSLPVDSTLPVDIPAEVPNVPSTFPELPEIEEAEEAEAATPVNPLELTEPDPLLPSLIVDRPLSPQEQSVLNAALDELNRQALGKLQAGDIPGAFDLWNRELRLRRFLGSEQEVESLSRVGEVAWRESQVTEVRFITERLQQIQQQEEAKSPVNYDLLLKIAQAYQSMRARDPAVALYDKLLVQARQEQNVDRERQILSALGEMHVAWFDYPNAAAAYEQLLAVAQGDADREIAALEQLSRIYQDNNQPEQAIAAQQRLVDIYQNRQEYNKITALKQAIGDEYVALGRPELAATSYQEAYAVARSAQQYAYAGDALQRLANLYVTLERLQDALVVYQLVLDVKQQSYDSLGMMNTYDQIGQLHRALGNNGQAIAAFRQGLQLAQQLNYKVSYFNNQIQALGGQ